ncbi:transposase [Streptantibioticus ferralitis]|uniref:transposase n=1 Tax=Streptantibioticus ferralitis TaxID=236510 RepID=UPI0035577F00
MSPRKDVHHGEQGKKKPRPRRPFTPEFKAEIVELCRRGDRCLGQVAKDFDLTETAARDWIRLARRLPSDQGGGGTSGVRRRQAPPGRSEGVRTSAITATAT